MKRCLCISLVAAGIAAWTPNSFAEVSVAPARPEPAAVGLRRSGAMSKAGFHLARAYAEWLRHLAAGRRQPFEPSDRALRYSQGRVLVSARADDAAEALQMDLERLGLRNGARREHTVAGLLPLAALDRAVALPSLRSIHAVAQPIVHTGAVTSQGDAALHADLARLVEGVDGSGVQVGVISDSFDVSTVVDLHASDDVASGDLPAGVQVLAESSLCGVYVICIDEGRAMLQIVHDLAPGADLMFHTVYGSEVDFANAIDQLAATGADVIVDDVLYLTEPMFEDGMVARAVDDAVAAGIAYYSAAGNQGRESYEAPFDDSNTVLCIEQLPPYDDCDPIFERVGRMHDFDPGPGTQVLQDITIPVGSSASIALQWDQPFGNALNDHIIVLLSYDGGLWITLSANDNVATGDPWEVLQYQNAFGDFGGPTGDQFKIAITYDDVDSIVGPAGRLKTVVYGGSIASHATASGTLVGHANAAGAAAVGAAYWADTPEHDVSPPALEPYSSAGGTPILFDADGTRLVTPEARNQPRFVATDGVSTTFFFNDVDGDGTPDFYGTSAAAPHAAAIAALMLEASPAASPAQINAALADSAIDMNTAGDDPESGAGLIQADTAVDALTGAVGLPPTADFSYVATATSVAFTDRSSDPDGSIVAYAWDFGDGTGSTEPSPVHDFAATGTYPVRLTVHDNDGNGDAAVQSVTLGATPANGAPIPGFDYACDSLNCQFSNTSVDPEGDSMTWAWDFGDGNTSAEESPSKTYASRGTYTVTLSVDDGVSAVDASATLRLKPRGTVSGSASGDSGGTSGDVTTERGRKKCSDGVDNDNDGLIDGADPDC